MACCFYVKHTNKSLHFPFCEVNMRIWKIIHHLRGEASWHYFSHKCKKIDIQRLGVSSCWINNLFYWWEYDTQIFRILRYRAPTVVPVSISISRLTARDARTWLVNNDAEAAHFWQGTQNKNSLIQAVEDNLEDFGIGCQSGNVILVSNQERFKTGRKELVNFIWNKLSNFI